MPDETGCFVVKQNLHTHASVSEKHLAEGDPHPKKSSGLLDTILSNTTLADQTQKQSSSDKINGIVVGRVVSAAAKNAPMVEFPANVTGTPIQALATVPVEARDSGRDVAIAFVNGDPAKPVILGFMHVPADATQQTVNGSTKTIDVEKESETVTISAEKQLVLKCGESSITLTKAGKVLLNGAYISSRAKGVNRLRGGSVLLN